MTYSKKRIPNKRTTPPFDDLFLMIRGSVVKIDNHGFVLETDERGEQRSFVVLCDLPPRPLSIVIVFARDITAANGELVLTPISWQYAVIDKVTGEDLPYLFDIDMPQKVVRTSTKDLLAVIAHSMDMAMYSWARDIASSPGDLKQKLASVVLFFSLLRSRLED